MPNLFTIETAEVKNYRSIRHCNVELDPLTFFVGPNGSGKTSFVDAIAFLADSLKRTLEQAVNSRAGIFSLLHAPVTYPSTFSLRLDLRSTEGFKGKFFVEIESSDGTAISVAREECHVNTATREDFYTVENGVAQGTPKVLPPASKDRLYLVNASGLPEFRPIYDFLSGVSSAEPISRGAYWMTARLPGGLTARFGDLLQKHPQQAELIQVYMRAISPLFSKLEVVDIEKRPWLRFIDSDSHSGSSNAFYIPQISAGILHAAEILLELFTPPEEGRPASPVLLEEPEALLHPAAVRVLRDAFIEASQFRQVLVTSHSPDLLDDKAIPGKWIRVVERDAFGTHIYVLDHATNSIIRDQLFTPGELLRQGGLVGTSGEHGDSPQSNLFEQKPNGP